MILIYHDDKFGVKHFPHKQKDGFYRAADPALSRDDRKLGANQIRLSTLEDVALHVLRGFHVRMAPDGKSDADLVAPQNIVLRYVKP